MPSLKTFLEKIPDGESTRAAVPMLGQDEEARVNGFYRKKEPPVFSLILPDDTIVRTDKVDTSRVCMVTFDFNEQTITAIADILDADDLRTLNLRARETVSRNQARDFFRIDGTTKVIASSLIPEQMAYEGEHWRLSGDTIDLSGSGLLCAFTEPLEEGQRVKIELTLPTRGMEMVEAFGHVVRCRKMNDGTYHIALHFDDINSENQDKIMAYCFELQRRYLKMRVQVKNREIW